ncbi:hypothetical protein MKW98_006535 [Papaver atlanticum]|uniref:Protein kinase domain-containing protein n=1 Tax=Papaver atlanticum TaxID=357466 RepID=A0AAD4XQS4_9MAGN|nr:hypothetical protein MKW98_006535 [Papaver atlanticum]
MKILENYLGTAEKAIHFSRMFVFEYASNGTLYEYLHFGEGCQLSWRRRMNIIVGIARGLRYLHTELEPAFAMPELHPILLKTFLSSWLISKSGSLDPVAVKLLYAKEYLELPVVMSYLEDPELRHFKYYDIKRLSMQVFCPMLENLIETSIAFDLSDSSLAWA